MKAGAIEFLTKPFQERELKHVGPGMLNKQVAAAVNVGKKRSSFIELTSWKKSAPGRWRRW